jgi:hypothetical protein
MGRDRTRAGFFEGFMTVLKAAEMRLMSAATPWHWLAAPAAPIAAPESDNGRGLTIVP